MKNLLLAALVVVGLFVPEAKAQLAPSILTFSLTTLVEATNSGIWVHKTNTAAHLTSSKTTYKSVQVKVTNKDILNLLTNGYGGKFPVGAMLVVIQSDGLSETVAVSDKTGTNVIYVPAGFSITDVTLDVAGTALSANVDPSGTFLMTSTYAGNTIYTDLSIIASYVEHQLKKVNFATESETFEVQGDFVINHSSVVKKIKNNNGSFNYSMVNLSTGKASVAGLGYLAKYRTQDIELEPSSGVGIVSGTISASSLDIETRIMQSTDQQPPSDIGIVSGTVSGSSWSNGTR